MFICAFILLLLLIFFINFFVWHCHVDPNGFLYMLCMLQNVNFRPLYIFITFLFFWVNTCKFHWDMIILLLCNKKNCFKTLKRFYFTSYHFQNFLLVDFLAIFFSSLKVNDLLNFDPTEIRCLFTMLIFYQFLKTT